MDQTGSGSEPFRQLRLTDAPTPLTTASISLELLQDCLGTLDHLATGITNLGVDATEDPTQAPQVRVLLEELLMPFQQCENDLGIYPPSPVDL